MSTPYARDLFGGTIKAMMPMDLIDVSNLHQVPDNQEVFLYHQSDVSIIIEVLQALDEPDDNKAIGIHFDSLAHDNSANAAEIQNVNVMQKDASSLTPPAIVLHGVQSVQKFNHKKPDSVKILMALYRVKSKKADLVATFNIPLATEGGGPTSEAMIQQATRDFNEFVKSLTIVDLDLFA